MLNLEQQIFRQIERSSSILIALPTGSEHQANKGDAVASSLALYLFLKKIGKRVEIVSQPTGDKNQSTFFLPGHKDIQNSLINLRRFIVSINIGQAKIHNIKYTVDQGKLNFIISPAEGWFQSEDVSTRAGEFKYDLVLTIGTSDLESLGKIYDDNIEFFYKTTVINIDNQATNEEFGQINFLDLNAVALSEIVYYLLKNYQPQNIDENTATCLLAGIIQKTKNFKTANLTPRTLLTTSELIDRGARREEIIDHLYRARNFSSLKLWGKILNNLQTSKTGSILWSTLKQSDYPSSFNGQGELDDLIDELITNVPGTKLVAIMIEEENNTTTIRLYSLKNINALEALKNHNPSGNSRIVSATIKSGPQVSIHSIISELEGYLDKLSS